MRSVALRRLFCRCQLRVGMPRRRPLSRRCVASLTLEEAVRRGLETSHRLREATARSELPSSGRRAAPCGGAAAGDGQAGYTRTNHVDPFGVVPRATSFASIYPDIPDNYRTRLDLQWPIYTGGRLDALERAARIERRRRPSTSSRPRAPI